MRYYGVCANSLRLEEIARAWVYLFPSQLTSLYPLSLLSCLSSPRFPFWSCVLSCSVFLAIFAQQTYTHTHVETPKKLPGYGHPTWCRWKHPRSFQIVDTEEKVWKERFWRRNLEGKVWKERSGRKGLEGEIWRERSGREGVELK